MKVSFTFGGQCYANFDTKSDAFKQLDIPASEKLKIVNDEKWNAIRTLRDILIKKTDWTQVGDSALTVVEQDEFTTYRQALRELPQSTNNPDDIVWPVKPE